MRRETSLDLHHCVAQPGIVEGAADHDLVVGVARHICAKSAGCTPRAIRKTPAEDCGEIAPPGLM